jgi:hypothetical protein
MESVPIAGPGAGGAYVAKAVHFDGATWLSNAGLTATDSNYYGFSYWVRRGDVLVISPLTFGHDIPDTFAIYSSFGSAGPNQIRTDFSPPDFSSEFRVTSSGEPLPVSVWHHVICAVDTVSKEGKLYVDGVDVTNISIDSGAGFTFVVNGVNFFFGGDDDGDSLIGDFADVRLAPGQNWLTAGDISPATMALFYDPATGKPVDPAVATTALGAPCILFSGDAASFTTNQGTGGPFTLTGALTDALSSPSDP